MTDANDTPPGDPPAAPTILAAQDNGDGTAEISFADNSDDETGFELQREKDHKKHGWSNAIIINLAANSTSHTDASGKGTFRYRLRAGLDPTQACHLCLTAVFGYLIATHAPASQQRKDLRSLFSLFMADGD